MLVVEVEEIIISVVHQEDQEELAVEETVEHMVRLERLDLQIQDLDEEVLVVDLLEETVLLD
jgi:hypothetical protein